MFEWRNYYVNYLFAERHHLTKYDTFNESILNVLFIFMGSFEEENKQTVKVCGHWQLSLSL